MSEAKIHSAILAYLEWVLPGALIHHSPNEIGLSGIDVARQIAKAKANGTKSGWPDFEVVLPGRVIWLEVKTSIGRLSPAQKAIHERIAKMGHSVAVVRSIDDARAILAAWDVETAETAGRVKTRDGAVMVPFLGQVS